MRAISIMLLFFVSNLAFAGADYVREKKWADEIVHGIVVGDPVYLELKNTHKFLTLYTEAKSASTGLVIVHGTGIHPDWNMIGTLRTQLADLGYTTLSIQMPVLGNEAASDAYLPLFPEAAERIGVAVEFLKAKGYKRVVIVSHSMGSAMSRMYVVNNPSAIAGWATLGMGQGYTYTGILVPVLDLYGEHDLPPVLKMAKKRAASLKGKAKSRQVRLPRSDHFYTGQEAEMVKNVSTFLEGLK